MARAVRALRPGQGVPRRPRGGRDPGGRLLAVVFSSPDEKPVTVKSWSTANPVDFAQTAITELDGTSATATYGPPYNATPGPPSRSAPFSPEQLVRRAPSRSTPPRTTSSARSGRSPTSPGVHAAVADYTSASAAQQASWTAAYEKAVANATSARRRAPDVPAGDYGPVGHDDRLAHVDGPQRRPRRRPAELPAVLRDRLHQAPAVHRRRHLPRRSGPDASTCRATSGA